MRGSFTTFAPPPGAAEAFQQPHGDGGVGLSAPFQTKEQHVADVLREGILAGALPRGQKLKQAVIAQRLKTSITPVREALKILEAEGYIVITAHRGAVVAPLQMAGIEELFQLRLIMEPRLTNAAARLLTALDLDELAGLNSLIRQSAGRSLERSERTNDFRFHFRLYQHADLPQALHFTRVVWAKYPFDVLGTLPNRAEQIAHDHDHVLAALRDRDGHKAARAMQAHVEAEQALFRSSTGGSTPNAPA